MRDDLFLGEAALNSQQTVLHQSGKAGLIRLGATTNWLLGEKRHAT